jgi:late competence protein required for DNA uptake (superfamily II DNA/RNA helicase)
MTFRQPLDAIRLLAGENVSSSDSFDLSVYCSKLLRSGNDEAIGRDIVIRVRDSWRKIPEHTRPIWNDLTEAAGLYPYVNPEYLSKSALLRYEYHKSPYLENVYFHEEQQTLSIELKSKKAVVVSAPTSFGKSLLIEEIIASQQHENIVIIQPTLALLDETRKKLLKYRREYKLIVSTDQVPDLQLGNIFLFTGERVVEYAHFPAIDFFVIDEFYKLSLERDDDRAIALNQAFHKLLGHTNKFYLLGPIVKNIPVNFKKRFDLTWFPTNFATVAVNEKSLEVSNKLKATEKKIEKKKSLFDYLSANKDQTLIYCSSPNKATQLAIDYINSLVNKSDEALLFDNAAMIEWIGENISRKWSLIDSLKAGVGFHHGALPRHLGSSIVDAFNDGNIRHLFCTSTLIEGVNTSAKTVILFDKQKGTAPIDFFDYKNIAGRSGRMNKHFIGNVIRFEKQPEQMDLFVDIPLFDQKNAPLEILIGLEDSEVDTEAKERLNNFNQLTEDLKEVIRKNKGVSIEGQQNIIEHIESDIPGYHALMNWSSYPKYEQLLAVIKLAWAHLLKPGENKADIRSPEQLTFLTIKYATLKSTTALINATINEDYWVKLFPDDQERINKVTFFILNVTRHWFDYKLPKWIAVISELQHYVFTKNNRPPGNYSFYAGLLENGFLPKGFAALMEYDIPFSAIKKIQSLLADSNTAEQNIMYINQLTRLQLKKMGLLDYEIKKIRESF